MVYNIEIKNISAREEIVNYNKINRSILIFDNLFDFTIHSKIYDSLISGPWDYGWKSSPSSAGTPFWHRHFAGAIQPSIGSIPVKQAEDDPENMLRHSSPLVHAAWTAIRSTILESHILVRSYANGLPYGAEGTIHKDAKGPHNLTCIYYANPEWHPDFGGETVFFQKDYSDLLCSIYPRPNRLVVFPGNIPHVARGVTRVCPAMRVTLMFKVEEIVG